MSILDEVLIEEYERSERIKQLYLEKLSSLPKGYLSRKKINGKVYVYLQHREGDKIVSQFIPDDKVKMIEKEVEKRQKYQKGLREIEDDQKKIRKALGSLVSN
jgi:hypothetical protein